MEIWPGSQISNPQCSLYKRCPGDTVHFVHLPFPVLPSGELWACWPSNVEGPRGCSKLPFFWPPGWYQNHTSSVPSTRLKIASSLSYCTCLTTQTQTRHSQNRTKIIPHNIFVHKLYFLLPLYVLLPRVHRIHSLPHPFQSPHLVSGVFLSRKRVHKCVHTFLW